MGVHFRPAERADLPRCVELMRSWGRLDYGDALCERLPQFWLPLVGHLHHAFHVLEEDDAASGPVVRGLASGVFVEADFIAGELATPSAGLSRRIIELTLEEFSPPKVDWGWLSFGSEGRFEQTLSTDQDNGIIFEADDRDADQVRKSLLPFAESVNRKLWVACKNQADGDTAEAACEVACTACGKCVADAPPGLMRLNGNLAAINYELNVWATRVPIERCPTGAIVWFDNPNHSVKGAVAKKVLRNEPLPVLH